MVKSNWQPGQILKIQEELPKVPKISDLPRVSAALSEEGNRYSCPNLVYCIWKSGRHAAMRLSCKTWRCANCSQMKIAEMSRIVADATFDVPYLHEMEITDRERDKVTRYFRTHNISSLSVKLTDGIYVLSSGPGLAKTWHTQEIARAEAIVRIHNLNPKYIKRRDFTLDWRPEARYDPKRDTVVLATTFSNMDDLKFTLEEFGQTIDSEYVAGDPLDVMERFSKLRTDLELIFDVT